jgi:hypothetical protein
LGPLRFVVASFFIGGICFGPLAFWGCLFFHRRSFILVPLHFGVAFFLSEVFYFEPANEGCNNASSFAALAYVV